MVANLSFRKAEVTDYERMYLIWVQGQSQSLGIHTKGDIKFKEQLYKNFGDEQNIVNVAVLEGEIIGWLGLFKIFSNPLSGQFARQSSTYMDTNYKIHGLVSDFVKYSLNQAKLAGIQQIYSFAIPENSNVSRIIEPYVVKTLDIPSSIKGNIPSFNLYIVDLDSF
jgi:N-acetylglutamate synthase-like GNAT family acetyltransferase